MANNLAQHLRLMLVTDDRLLGDRDPVAVARAAVAGGATAVQLRLKAVSARELIDLAIRLRTALSVPVLVNDRPDVAAASGCGVHLGPEDLPVSLARRILPAGTLIGASVGSPDEVAGNEDADYWGVGPWRVTGTKTDAGEAIGAAGLAAVVRLAGGKPCIAIGSVRPEDIPDVITAGGAGVAVVSGILAGGDVEAAARRYFEWFRVPRSASRDGDARG